MKKFFYALMFAAASLMVSCGDPSEEGTGTGNGEGDNEQFYGFMMDNADITAIAADEFIIQMTIENEETMSFDRFLSLQFKTTTPVTDGIIPEGTYTLTAGVADMSISALVGSFYMNYLAGYQMLITEGTLEVKHTAGGYRLTASFDGTTLGETPEQMEDIECRYEGSADIYGNDLAGVINEADAFYQGIFYADDESEEGVPYWVVQFYTETGLIVQLFVNVEDCADPFSAGIPSGTYPIDGTMAPGHIDMSYQTTNGYGGSMVLFIKDGKPYIYALIQGGSAEIVNNGNGTYKVDLTFYNETYLPLDMAFEGTIELVDESEDDDAEGVFPLNIESVSMTYVGACCWFVALTDSQFYDGMGAAVSLVCYNPEDKDGFEFGLESGEWTFSETCEGLTIYPGSIEDNSLYPSYVVNNENQGLDLCTGGYMDVEQMDDGTYAIEFVVSGTTYTFAGAYEGEVTAVDGTAETTMAKAPAKNAIKPATNLNKQHIKVENANKVMSVIF